MLPAGVLTRMPSQISSGSRSRAVDQDADLGRLAALAQQRDLVDRQRLDRRAAIGHGAHPQRVQRRGLGGGDARRQVVLGIVVHQEADRAAIHAVDRDAAAEEAVQRLQHEAVAAECDDDVGRFRRGGAVACGQGFLCLARRLVLGGEDGEFHDARPARQARAASRCSSSGMPARTRAVTAGSIRAVAQPMPSEHFATTCPQGSAISEWP